MLTIRKILSRIFRPNYHDYIQSSRWRAKADACKRRARWRCQLCNRPHSASNPLHAHHRTYERLGFEDKMDLVALCPCCHSNFHSWSKHD